MKTQKFFKYCFAGLLTVTSLTSMPQKAQSGFGFGGFGIGIGTRATHNKSHNRHHRNKHDFIESALKATTILIDNNDEQSEVQESLSLSDNEQLVLNAL